MFNEYQNALAHRHLGLTISAFPTTMQLGKFQNVCFRVKSKPKYQPEMSSAFRC